MTWKRRRPRGWTAAGRSKLPGEAWPVPRSVADDPGSRSGLGRRYSPVLTVIGRWIVWFDPLSAVVADESQWAQSNGNEAKTTAHDRSLRVQLPTGLHALVPAQAQLATPDQTPLPVRTPAPRTGPPRPLRREAGHAAVPGNGEDGTKQPTMTEEEGPGVVAMLPRGTSRRPHRRSLSRLSRRVPRRSAREPETSQ